MSLPFQTKILGMSEDLNRLGALMALLIGVPTSLYWVAQGPHAKQPVVFYFACFWLAAMTLFGALWLWSIFSGNDDAE
jgi:hypothetical protein